MDDLHNLLGQKPKADDRPPAPWTPPGEKFESTPVEEDVPEANSARQPHSGDNKSPDSKTADKKPAADENWWDKPAETPEIAGPMGQESERYQDRHRPVTPLEENAAGKETAAAGDQEETPRERLTAHQAQMQQALTENADEARKAAGHAHDLAKQLGQQSGNHQAGKSPAQQSGAEQQPGKQQQSGQQPSGQQPGNKQQPGQRSPTVQSRDKMRPAGSIRHRLPNCSRLPRPPNKCWPIPKSSEP